jgi:hypothetical protein
VNDDDSLRIRKEWIVAYTWYPCMCLEGLPNTTSTTAYTKIWIGHLHIRVHSVTAKPTRSAPLSHRTGRLRQLTLKLSHDRFLPPPSNFIIVQPLHNVQSALLTVWLHTLQINIQWQSFIGWSKLSVTFSVCFAHIATGNAYLQGTCWLCTCRM